MKFIACYTVLWGIAGLAGALCRGYLPGEESVRILVCAVVLKWLDICLQYLLMLLLYICTKQITVGFLALLAGNLLCMVPQEITAFLPFGLSGMARITCFPGYPGIDPAAAGCGLFGGILLVSGWLLLFGQNRILD